MCPRSTLEKKDEHCLAKLSIINDNIYVVCIESTTMNLEARAGIWGHTICVSPTPDEPGTLNIEPGTLNIKCPFQVSR